MSDESTEPAEPEPGQVRIENGRVEVFDGERWGPYRALPESDGPVFRGPGGSADER